MWLNSDIENNMNKLVNQRVPQITEETNTSLVNQ